MATMFWREGGRRCCARGVLPSTKPSPRVAGERPDGVVAGNRPTVALSRRLAQARQFLLSVTTSAALCVMQ